MDFVLANSADPDKATFTYVVYGKKIVISGHVFRVYMYKNGHVLSLIYVHVQN